MDDVWNSSGRWLLRHSVLPAGKIASYSCGLCGAPVFSKHAVAIFSLTATKEGQLSSRIKDMLDVEVGLDNGLPQHQTYQVARICNNLPANLHSPRKNLPFVMIQTLHTV